MIIALVVIASAMLLVMMLFMFDYAEKIERDNAWSFNNTEDLSAPQSHPDNAVNLNEASRQELAKIPGVGRKIAADIVSYREKHGSFASVSELLDIYSIDKTLYDSIKDKLYVDNDTEINDYTGIKLNLNTATLRELMQVDGITETIAENIISYRKTNGDFISVRELLEVEGIGEILYNDIYLRFTV